MDKMTIGAYIAVAATALLAPEYLFLEYMDLQFSIMGYDLSATLAWILGILVGVLGSAVIRKLTATGGSSGVGGGLMSSLFRSGGLQ